MLLSLDRGGVAPLDDGGHFEWVSRFRISGPIHVPVEQTGELLEELLGMPRLPRLDLPEELRVERVALAPVPRLSVIKELVAAGLRRSPYAYDGGPPLELPVRQFGDVVRDLLAEDWIVEAEGKRYRKPGEVRVDVRSAVDGFELRGAVEYGDTYATIPALLAALRRGETTVRLGDGTFGLLPEAWLA